MVKITLSFLIFITFLLAATLSTHNAYPQPPNNVGVSVSCAPHPLAPEEKCALSAPPPLCLPRDRGLFIQAIANCVAQPGDCAPWHVIVEADLIYVYPQTSASPKAQRTKEMARYCRKGGSKRHAGMTMLH